MTEKLTGSSPRTPAPGAAQPPARAQVTVRLRQQGALTCVHAAESQREAGDTAVPFSHVKTLSGTRAQESPEGLRLPHPRSFQVGTRGPASHPALATSRPTSQGHGSGHDLMEATREAVSCPSPHLHRPHQQPGSVERTGGSHCTQPRLE